MNCFCVTPWCHIILCMSMKFKTYCYRMHWRRSNTRVPLEFIETFNIITQVFSRFYPKNIYFELWYL